MLSLQKKRGDVLPSRDLISFFVTSLLYFVGVVLFFYTASSVKVSDKVSELQTIELSLQSYQPPEPVVEEKLEPIKEPEPPVEEPKPEPKPEPPKPEPLPVEPLLPKPEPKKIEPKKEQPKKIEEKKPEIKKEVKKPKKKKVKKTTASSAKRSTRKQQASAKQKDLFLSKVRSRINKNKTYPKIAKRRGMQGSVRVSFTILRNGDVGKISVSGPKAFHKSAKNAVKRSFPISVQNVPISLPKNVSFTMNYRLR